MASPKQLRIVVIGKTGVGKSSLSNALLKVGNKADPYRVSENFFRAETVQCQRVRRTVRGRDLMVVDSPGAIDTDRGGFNPLKEIDKVMSFCPDGYHACFLVLRLDHGITPEEETAINQLKLFLGDAFLTFAIVVFTHGDDVDNDEQKFKARVNEAKEKQAYLRLLLRTCGNRMVMVDTSKERDESVLDTQMEKLLTMVEEQLDGEVYTESDVQANRQKPEVQKFVERDSLNLLIFGEARAGKSSVANALLETDKFKVTQAIESASTRTQRLTDFFFGKNTTIVDAPGIGSDDESIERLISAAGSCQDGFHAFLLVVRADGDLKVSGLQTGLQKLRNFFSASRFNSKLIVVFTHVDAFHRDRDFKQKLSGARKSVKELDDLLTACDDRFVVMGNCRDRSEEKRMEDMDDLRDLIDKVGENGTVTKYQASQLGLRRQASPKKSSSWCSVM